MHSSQCTSLKAKHGKVKKEKIQRHKPGLNLDTQVGGTNHKEQMLFCLSEERQRQNLARSSG
jgi:hypothetical protein